jgi:hypothetical protein
VRRRSIRLSMDKVWSIESNQSINQSFQEQSRVGKSRFGICMLNCLFEVEALEIIMYSCFKPTTTS